MLSSRVLCEGRSEELKRTEMNQDHLFLQSLRKKYQLDGDCFGIEGTLLDVWDSLVDIAGILRLCIKLVLDQITVGSVGNQKVLNYPK